MNKAIFLDRDGVINIKPPEHDYVKNWKEFIMIDGVGETIKKLKQHLYLVFIISNQRGIARGLMTEEDLTQIHCNLNAYLEKNYSCGIDDFYYCPHDYSDNCECRKPKPGLILKACKDYQIDLKQSYFIGDSFDDLNCGLSAGVKTFILPSNQLLKNLVEVILK